MNITKYKENLTKEVSEFENQNGDIENAVRKQFQDDLHTMQMKEAYQNLENIKILLSTMKELSGFEALDLIDLESYTRLISGDKPD